MIEIMNSSQSNNDCLETKADLDCAVDLPTLISWRVECFLVSFSV